MEIASVSIHGYTLLRRCYKAWRVHPKQEIWPVNSKDLHYFEWKLLNAFKVNVIFFSFVSWISMDISRISSFNSYISLGKTGHHCEKDTTRSLFLIVLRLECLKSQLLTLKIWLSAHTFLKQQLPHEPDSLNQTIRRITNCSLLQFRPTRVSRL